MKRNIFFPIVLLILVFPLVINAQFKVVHYSTLSQEEQQRVMPDMEGMVLVAEDQFIPVQHSIFREGIVVMDGWPVSKTGSTNRGGIYCNLDDDPELELVYNIGNSVYAWNIDGTDVTGWPQPVTNTPSSGAPAFGDIDGDGAEEIVVSCQQPGTGNTGKIHAFKKDGTVVAGFPITCAGGPMRTPVLADLENDGAMEIIVELRSYPNGTVCVYHGDGTIKEGWPAAMDYIPGSAAAVGDIDGDGIPEIVAESYYKVWAFTADGDTLPGFPYEPGTDRVFSYSSPVIANIDGLGPAEILVGDHSLSAGNGAVHVIKSDGTAYPGWPKLVGQWIYGPASVADIDGDGSLDVATGDQVLSGVPSDKVYAWNKEGTYLPGFPIGPIWAINCQIIIADLDGDGLPELMFDDNTSEGIYNGYNHDGTMMDGWPLDVVGTSFFINPFVADMNGDGLLDLNGGGYEMDANKSSIYLWTSSVAYDQGKAILPVLQYNVRHTGVFGEKGNPTVSIHEILSNDMEEIHCYPNPCPGMLNIGYRLVENDRICLTVYDLTGNAIDVKQVGLVSSGLNTIRYNAVALKTGLYLLKLTGQSGVVLTGRFTVVK